jgi:hypothetical protein
MQKLMGMAGVVDGLERMPNRKEAAVFTGRWINGLVTHK